MRVLATLPIVVVALAVAFAGGQGGVVVPLPGLGALPLLVVLFGGAFVVQWAAFVPAFLRRTERFYDLTGSLTYLALVATAVALGPRDPRSLLLAVFVGVWAARLGLFLFRRVHQQGKDGRFDEIKESASRFFLAWTLQGLWIVLTAGAALAAMTTAAPSPLGALDALGAAVFLFGFGVEAIADRQKALFRRDPGNKDRFIASGLWAWSRHPNYFGEITLWVGVALIASSTLAGWQLVTLVSPLFVAGLLRFGSGVPILEERAQKRWGEDPAYQRYLAETPLLLPRPPRRRTLEG